MRSPLFAESLSFRLSLLVATVVMIGVCVIATVFIVQDFQKTVNSERLRLQDAAVAFAAASSDPLDQNDTSALYQVLRGISDLQHSTFIDVRDASGQSIAEMGTGVALTGRDGAIEQHSLWSLVWADTLTAEAIVWSAGQQIGTLSIQSDISWLRDQYRFNLVLMIFIAVMSGLAIATATNFGISRALRPLKHMSGALIEMGQSPDLTKRFEFERQDEVGVLARAFNNAFDTIQQRDAAIRQHRDTLESTVQQRTSELKIAADEARQANAAKSDFLATMSHEIRTPMNGMLVMAELLSASDLTPRQQRFAEVISRSGNSLLHIINDILDLSKVESGKLELEEVPFSLSSLVEDTVSLFAARAHEKALKIAMVVSPDIASQHVGDPTRLGQILSNLTNNALKFTEEGGVIIRVTAEASDSHQKLNISVIDTGIGIAADKLNSIFEAFSQADQSTTRNYGGTGLGLSISKRFAEAMGGQISATSVENEGTTFSVSIALPVFVQAKSLEVLSRPYKVGVIDRSEIVQSATVEMMGLAGLEAVALAENSPLGGLDLIVCGSQSLQAISDAAAPILVLTDYGVAGPGATLQANICGHLNTPINLSDLDKIIIALKTSDWSQIEAEEAKQSRDVPKSDFSGMRVLAVDDNAVNREVLNEALSALGVKAIFAESGSEALSLTDAQRFDLIFMDCSMPVMDGYQATAAIRSQNLNQDTFIVALTAHVTGSAAERWKSAGMDSYIAKPFTVSQLESVLKLVDGGEGVIAPTHVEEASSRMDDLLSEDVLAMFAQVSAATGNDMKTKVFSMFCGQVDEGKDALLECCRLQKDAGALKDLAHALKSMCSSAGALRAQLLCGDIEANAESNIWPNQSQIDALVETIAETKKLMNSAPLKSVAPGSSLVAG